MDGEMLAKDLELPEEELKELEDIVMVIENDTKVSMFKVHQIYMEELQEQLDPQLLKILLNNHGQDRKDGLEVEDIKILMYQEIHLRGINQDLV